MLQEPVIEPRENLACDWHYDEFPLERWARYKGPLADNDPEEVCELFEQCLRYFAVGRFLPTPPYGLPGTTGECKADVRYFAGLGVRYLSGIMGGRPREVWNTHDEILRILNEPFHQGRRYQSDLAIYHELKKSAEAAEAERAKPRADVFTYFIRSSDGPIKIGIALDIKKRLAALQTSNPHRLEVAAYCLGGRELEQEYHARFEAHRLAGEWFAPHADILAEITRLTQIG